jgi:hypothetical protein
MSQPLFFQTSRPIPETIPFARVLKLAEPISL